MNKSNLLIVFFLIACQFCRKYPSIAWWFIDGEVIWSVIIIPNNLKSRKYPNPTAVDL
jgi:hypothetical protein